MESQAQSTQIKEGIQTQSKAQTITIEFFGVITKTPQQ